MPDEHAPSPLVFMFDTIAEFETIPPDGIRPGFRFRLYGGWWEVTEVDTERRQVVAEWAEFIAAS